MSDSTTLTARAALLVALGAAGYQAVPGEVDPLGLAALEERLDALEAVEANEERLKAIEERLNALEAPSSGPALAIEDCGLVCDGQADDAARLNACLQARKHVVLPAARTCAVRPTHAGGYLAVAMPSDSMLTGAGASSVLRVLPTLVGTQERMSRGVGAIGPVERVTLRDFAIKNESPRFANEQGHAVFFANGARHLRIHDLDVLGTAGDGVYLGKDVAFADVRGVVAVDVARNAVTIEGNAAVPRAGVRVTDNTRYYTDASDPTQRGGRLVDVEAAGPGLVGLVVLGNTGAGGIDLGNVSRGAVVGNVADRYHMVNATRTVVVGNSFLTSIASPTMTAQRQMSGLVVGNWFERSTPGQTVSVEKPELFGLPVADLGFFGNRWLYGVDNIKPLQPAEVTRGPERVTLGDPPGTEAP